jgi:hypothetical protein
MRKTMLFSFLVFFLIFSSSASAQEFEVWSAPFSLCRCGSSSQEVFVLNNGADDVFLVSLSGSASNIASLSESTFFIPAGSQKSFLVSYHAPCEGVSGGVDIEISSISGVKKVISQDIVADICANTAVMPEITVSSACPCSPLEYSFVVKNSGGFIETYSFEASEFSSNFIFSPNSVRLSPGQEVTVKAVVKNSCSVHGNYSFVITVFAEKSRTKAKIPVSALIVPCYSYSITAGRIGADKFVNQSAVYDVCRNFKYQIPLLFENRAPFRNTYDISVSGKYASIPYSRITLEKSQRALVNISFAPEDSGNYSIFVDAESVLGNRASHLRLPVVVERCYDVNINAPSRIIVSRPVEVPVFLENLGSKSANVLIKLSGATAVLEKSAAIVGGNETINLILDYDGKARVENAEFSIKLDDGTIKSRKITIVFGKPFFYAYKYYILLFLVLAVLVVYAAMRLPKRSPPPKKNKKVVAVKKKVNSGIVSLSGAPEIKKKDFNILAVLGVILVFLILMLLFSLPVPTLTSSLSEKMIGAFPEQRWDSGRILRADFGKYINGSLIVGSESKVSAWSVGNVVYFMAEGNWTGSNFIDLTITKDGNSTKTEKIFFTIDPLQEDGYFMHGVNVYKTFLMFAYDYGRAYYVYSAMSFVIFVVLVIFFVSKRKKLADKKIKKLSNQLTRITIK